MSPPQSVDVVVIGAGMSGLHTAHMLIESGLKVAVLEARERSGGRLFGSPFDLGASWFWPGEDRVRALTEKLGIQTFEQYRAGDAVIDDLSVVQRYPGNPIDVRAFRVVGGTSTLATALTDRLPPDVVHFNSPVESITDDFVVRAANRKWCAQHVVLALPPALAVASIALPTQLPEHILTIARNTPVWMGDAVKVVAHYEEPFWREQGLAGAGMSRRGPLQEIHDMSGPEGELAALFGFARPSSLHPAVGDDIREQLARMYGPQAANPVELLIQDWSKEKWTTPGDTSGPANYGMFGHRAYRDATVDGRLHWSSTETAETYAGHIEGALEASERTVSAILHTTL